VAASHSRTRAAIAGLLAATAWGLQEPLDQRIFRCGYSDIALVGFGHRRLGFVVHACNGAAFGVGFDLLRRRTDVEEPRLALTLALAEHVALWPLVGLFERKLVRSPRAFAQSTWRHALFGYLLGRLA